MPLVDQGLANMNEIEQKLQDFEKTQSIIRENKTFEYTVKLPRPVHKNLPPPNKHSANCRNCNLTCHENCDIRDDNHKSKCNAMGHTNSPYIYTIEHVTEERIYEEMKQKYTDAEAVSEMLKITSICNNTLEEILFRPSPLSATEYIDTLITSEEMEKEDRYEERVQSLMEIQRQEDIDSKATQFTISANITLTVVNKIIEEGQESSLSKI
ncbi:hypothetical protein MAR_031175 [Mya arenaria]|uniref:Uncharacterized protein n=1 Tax=Mya arenaria TaxID=6604 RepID=A0ABY7F714_MYAAR|nr:hypothetical protein MAR_031175 [Mya arenaria]